MSRESGLFGPHNKGGDGFSLFEGVYRSGVGHNLMSQDARNPEDLTAEGQVKHFDMELVLQFPLLRCRSKSSRARQKPWVSRSEARKLSW